MNEITQENIPEVKNRHFQMITHTHWDENESIERYLVTVPHNTGNQKEILNVSRVETERKT